MLLLVGSFSSLKSNSMLRKLRTVFFFTAYVLYFTSWTFADIALHEVDLTLVEKSMRYAAYVLLGINLLFIDRTKKEWAYFAMMLALSGVYFLATRELFLVSLTILLMDSLDENLELVFKVSLTLLLALVTVTLSLCGLGILQNVITVRGGVDADISPRYAMGFYHSNVLPLLLFYVLSYLGVIKKGQIGLAVRMAALAAVVVAFLLCDSRMAFLASILLLAVYTILPKIRMIQPTKTQVFRVAANIVVMLSVVSLLLSFLHLTKNPVLDWINDKLLSGRIALGYQKLAHQGLHFFNLIPFTEYISDGVIVDNAYMSVIIRYGIVSVLILGILNYVGCKKYRNNTMVLLIFSIVCCLNFIDNDLLSYSCFPFLIAAVSRHSDSQVLTESRKVEKAFVSVVMSTYNETREELCLSINSILTQTHENLELIIVNDNPSNRELAEILESFKRKDSRIRVVENEVNVGLVHSLNKALTYARGAYIARMDADDIALPHRLETELRYLKEYRLDFVGSWVDWIDGNGEPMNHTMKVPDSHLQVFWAIRWGNCIPHPTWLLKKEIYDNLNGYRMIPSCEDYDFILRAIRAGYRVGNVPVVTLNYRIRGTGISESNKVVQTMTRYYLAANRRRIFRITPKDVQKQVNDRSNQYYRFEDEKQKMKRAMRNKKVFVAMGNMLRLAVNPNLYLWVVERIWSFARQ